MDEAEYCDRLAMMYRGKVIALGKPDTLKRELSTHSLLRLDTNDPLDTMRALENAPGIYDVAVFGGGLHVSVDNPAEAQARIRQILAAKKIEVRRLEPIMPSMEDVFVGLIEAEERKVA
jgi:ABC-2 type transport system ATP-binding protein